VLPAIKENMSKVSLFQFSLKFNWNIFFLSEMAFILVFRLMQSAMTFTRSCWARRKKCRHSKQSIIFENRKSEPSPLRNDQPSSEIVKVQPLQFFVSLSLSCDLSQLLQDINSLVSPHPFFICLSWIYPHDSRGHKRIQLQCSFFQSRARLQMHSEMPA
jgi:hypothetical protein